MYGYIYNVYNVLDVKPALNAVYNTTSDWTTPDYVYDDQLLYIEHVNDIYVTESTSQYIGDNVIFLGTDNGVHVIEERKGNEENSRIKRFYIK